MIPEKIQEIITRYRQSAIAMGAKNIATANAASQALRECFQVLRQTEEGMAAIASLMYDEDQAVRLSAAADCLRWTPDVARPVLEELRDSDGPWSHAAKWVLIEFAKGRLPPE